MNVTTGNLRVQIGAQPAVKASCLVTAGTVAAAALLLTACAGSSGGSSSPPVTSAPPVTEMPPMTNMPPMAGGAPMTVTAVEKDFSIELSETTFAPGTHTFRVQNQGSSPHDLSIKGPGVATAKSQLIDSGATTELTVTLEPGTYQLWCSVDGHRAKGMDTTITVG